MANYEDDALYGSGGSEFNKTLDEASSALDKIASKAEEADSKLSNLSESFNESGDSAKDAAVGFKDSAENIGKLSKSLDVAKIREYSKYMAGLNQALKEVVELSKESDQLEKLTGFSKGIDAENLGKAAKSIDKLGKSNVKNLDKLNKELESLKENLNSLGNLDNLKIKVSHGGGSKPKKETAEEKLKGDLSKLIGDSIGGLGGSNKLVGEGIGSVLKSLSKSKELKNLKKDADKFLAMEGAASKGMTKMAGGAAALGGKLAVALPIVTAIVAALGMAIKAGQEYHKVNVEMARSLEVVNDAQSKGSKQALETANDLVDVKNQWTRIGEDLTSVFEPLFNLAVDFLKVVGNVVESVTDILDKTNDEQYTPGNSKFKWYSQGLEEGSGEPESKSLPVLSDIASSAKQSGFTNTSAANLAIGTYDAAMDLAHQYGQEASKVAQDLADAWLTGSDAAKEYGIVVNDDVLAGYMAAQGVDIVNVEITDAMKQYYRYQLMLEQAAANNSDAMSEQIKDWTQLGAIIDKTKGKLFSFDEVIQLDAFDPTIPDVGTPSVDMGTGAEPEEPEEPDISTTINQGQSIVDILGEIASAVGKISSKVNSGVQENTQVTNDNSSAITNNSTVVNNNTTVVNNNSSSEVQNANSTEQSTQSNNNNTQSTNENSAAINNNNQVLQTNQMMNQALSNAISQLNGVLNGTGTQMATGAALTQGFTQAEMGMSAQTGQSTGYLVTLNTTLGTFQVAATSAIQAGQLTSQVQQMLGSSFLGCSVQAMNTTGILGSFTTQANSLNSITMMTIQMVSGASTAMQVLEQSAGDATQGMNEASDAITEVGNSAVSTTSKLYTLMEVLSRSIDKIKQYYDALNGKRSDSLFDSQGQFTGDSDIKGQASIGDIKAAGNLGGGSGSSSKNKTKNKNRTNVSINTSGGIWTALDLVGEVGDILRTGYEEGDLVFGGEGALEKNLDFLTEELPNTFIMGIANAQYDKFSMMGGMANKLEEITGIDSGPLKYVQDAAGMGLGYLAYKYLYSPLETATDITSSFIIGEEFGDYLREQRFETDTSGMSKEELAQYEAVKEAVMGDDPFQWISDMATAADPVLNSWMNQLLEFTEGKFYDEGWEDGRYAYNDRINEWMKWASEYENPEVGWDGLDYYGKPNKGDSIVQDENMAALGLSSAGVGALLDGQQFASGGIGTKEIRNATLFENDKAEAVIPLESQAGIDFLAKAMEQANSNNGGGAGSNVVVYLTLQGIFDTDDRGKWDRLVTKLAEALAIQSQRRGGLDYGSSY